MTALAFIDRYKAIRQQFYGQKKNFVAPIIRQKIEAKLVYVLPIGPVMPQIYNPKTISQGMAYAQQIIESGKVLTVPRNRGTHIMREVSARYNISLEDIISKRRDQKLVRARQEIMYRLCTETDWSLPQIGRLLGNRDHTTILHGRRKFQALLDAGKVTL